MVAEVRALRADLAARGRRDVAPSGRSPPARRHLRRVRALGRTRSARLRRGGQRHCPRPLGPAAPSGPRRGRRREVGGGLQRRGCRTAARHPQSPRRAQSPFDELAKARVDIARGQGLLPVDAKISVTDYTEQWLATLQVRPSTRADYVSYLRNRILPALGRRPLSWLRRSHIAAFVAGLVDEGLAASTVRHCSNVLSMVLRSACYDQVLHTSPCSRIKLPEIPGRTLPVLSPEQVHALLSAAPDCDRAVLTTAVGTGLRQGEILGLRLVHLNLLERQLAVEEQAMSPSGGQPFLTSDLKTPSSRRVLPLPQFVVLELARHLETYGAGSQGVVFANRRGEIWRRGSSNDSV